MSSASFFFFPLFVSIFFFFDFSPFLDSDKDRELGEAQAEIRALRLSERAREKAVEEVISKNSVYLSCYYSYEICFILTIFESRSVGLYVLHNLRALHHFHWK